MKEEKYIGYLKYSGKSVKDGLLDMRKSADALLGFDEILRYFLLKEDPNLKEIDFEIPVRIKKGTWGVYIPILVTWFSGVYLFSAAKKAGSDGFLETGPAKDITKIFQISIKSAQWIIKIASHIGEFRKKKFENVKIEQKNQEIFVKIPNNQGEYLSVPKKYFDLFTECPEKLFSKNARIIEQERILEFGIFENGKEEKISITEKEKFIFYSKSEDENILFPELKHGQNIELEGIITRGNERTNTLGFEYKEHILTCKPLDGGIAIFKNKIVSQQEGRIFFKVKIIGIINRTDQNGEFKEKRPIIMFRDVIPMEQKNKSQSLFDSK